MKRATLPTLLILLTFSAFSADKIPTLKSVMQGLGDSMNELNRGIFYEDFMTLGKD